MINALPSVYETRRLIECIGNGIDPRQDRRVRQNLDLEQLKNALKYQFLIAGHSSEIAGKYRLNNTPLANAFLRTIKGKKVVIFITKTRKRKKFQNIPIRGICIPLDYDYEPWAQEIYDYVRNNPHPFSFVKNPSSSKRLFEAASEYVFQSLNWNNQLYPGFNDYKPQSEGWGNFTSSCVNKSRIIDLKLNYNFHEANLNAFTSILGDHLEIDALLCDASKNDNIEQKEVINILINIGESYFDKLCVPRYSTFEYQEYR